MKAVLALVAAAGLAGCVAYDPYVYRAPYYVPSAYYASVPTATGTVDASTEMLQGGAGYAYGYPAYASYPYPYYSYPYYSYPYYGSYYYPYYPYYPAAAFGLGVGLGYWWGGGGHHHGHGHHAGKGHGGHGAHGGGWSRGGGGSGGGGRGGRRG